MKNKNLIQIFSKKYKIAILFIWILFSFTALFSQEIPQVNVTLKLKIVDGDLKNSQITVTKKGVPYKVIDPDKGGSAVDLPLGFEYAFTFTKIGYNTKSIIVDTHVPENREKGVFEKQVSEVALEKISGKLEDNYIQLIGKITYSMDKGDFDFHKGSPDKTAKVQKNEKQPLTSKSKAPVISKSAHNSSAVNKQSDIKPESSTYKPAVKNKEKVVVQEDNRKITTISINIDGKDYIYKKEEYSWGVHYYKNDKSITENTFRNEAE